MSINPVNSPPTYSFVLRRTVLFPPVLFKRGGLGVSFVESRIYIIMHIITVKTTFETASIKGKLKNIKNFYPYLQTPVTHVPSLYAGRGVGRVKNNENTIPESSNPWLNLLLNPTFSELRQQ